MRKLICIFVIVLLVFSLIACISSEDKFFIEKVKDFEENDYLLRNFDITYDEFVANTSEYSDPSFKYLDNEILCIYQGVEYTIDNISDLTLDELREIDMQYGIKYPLLYKYYEEPMEISKVYDGVIDTWKNIYVKRVFTSKYDKYPNEMEIYFNRKYTFEKDGDQWLLASVKDRMAYWNEEKYSKMNLTKDSVLGNIFMHGNTKIKYVTRYSAGK